jgi:hypothetical protein
MILSLVALLVQAQAPVAAPPAPPADERPVHIWIDSPSPLFRGVPVRVYVQVAASGNLVVLHRRTDGRIEPLFPASPKAAAWVHAGEYEIRSPGDRPAFILAEPDGGGMILAALTSGPIWFDEFAHVASWNPDALVASWSGADAEGALTDIVQRMLGDGAFNYDILSYIVRPAAYAQQPQLTPSPQAQDTAAYTPTQQEVQPPQTCVDCTFIGTQIVEAPIFIVPGRGLRHRDRALRERQPPCPAMTICGAPQEQVIARVIPTVGPVLGHPGVPPRGRPFTTPRHSGGTPAAEPRARDVTAPTTPALPLVPGRSVGGAGGERPPVATAASRSALALRYVRARPVAMATATPLDAAPQAPAAALAIADGPSTIVTPASLRPQGGTVGFRVSRGQQTGTQTFAQPRASAGMYGAGPTTAGVQPQRQAGTLAFPMAVWSGGAARAGTVRSGGRRH